MNLFELFATITLDDSGYKKGLGDAQKLTEKLGNSIKSGLATAAKVGTAAITAAATGIAALTKASVENYAEYEQLVGGAELMFGGAYDFIAEKAKNAYSTVQMSQNEYLQQVNGFATGLKTALGGNEQAAAELADRIINAEADIVAATGNAQENVQNAFNGIMKSNYTMLDNLQLGITPTKEGFQEVIDKVNEWNAANGNATNYMIDNLADAQNALVDYIEMQGLAGYAANEASQTISGSLASAKAAWSNLVTGVADDNADFGKLLSNFVNSVSTAAKNLVPRVKTAIAGIGQLISQTLPIIVKEIPGIIKDVVPDLIDAAMNLVSVIGQGLLDNADNLIDSAFKLIDKLVSTIGQGLIDNADSLADSAFKLIDKLVNFIVEGLPPLLDASFKIVEKIGNAIVEYAPQLIGSVKEIILTIIDILTNTENIKMIITTGWELVNAVAMGLINAIPDLVAKIPQIVNAAVEAFKTNLPLMIDTGVALFSALLDNTDEILNSLFDAIDILVDSIFDFLTKEDENGDTPMAKIIKAGFSLFSALLDKSDEIIAALASNITELCDKIINKIMETNWLEVGKDIIGLIADGMQAAAFSVGDVMTNIRNSLLGVEKGDIGYQMTAADIKETLEWQSMSQADKLGMRLANSGTKFGYDINITQNNYTNGDLDSNAQSKNNQALVNDIAFSLP